MTPYERPDVTASDAAGLLLRAMQSSPVGMALLAPDGRFVRVNHALIDLLRVQGTSLLDQRWQELLPPEAFAANRALAREMLDGIRDAARIRNPHVRPDGTRLWLDVAMSAVRGDDGALLNFMLQVSDVTDEVRTKERYQLLAENGTDVVITGSNDGVFEWLSPSVEALLGWRPGEMTGTHFIDYVHGEDRERVLEIQAGLREGRAQAFEIRFRTRAGGYRWISILAKPVFDEHGAVVGRMAGWRDFEAEVEARRALQEREHQYRLLAENASDVVYAAGLDRGITWVSPAVTKALGWKPEDLLGHQMSEFMHPEDRARTEGDRQQLYSSAGLVMPAEGYLTRIRAADGEYHWVKSYAQHLHDDAGAATGVVAGLTIVDSLVETAARLAESEQRFRLLAENASDVIAHTRDHVVQWVSPSLVEALGWLPEEWIGHSVREFIHPEDHALVASTRTQAIAGNRVMARARIRTRDDTYLWIEAHLGAFRDEHGAIDGVAVSFRTLGAQVLMTPAANARA